ncbi:choice-of-anchor B family protein [Marinirhabdus gelatinilytica]|uniref:Choice-of-anchor B domain-containing protein n=1 Tax=Marinirhabdus gelatinilytica TaxID=1703343 RepID=A0A370QAB0_9FLAO|nr:choice-of-anchor B family protein [Marinirhabdus gelatinilytica]RDK85304.1 choice-of-anchor B domain-containing protein [Marinirhabdus gelatinilytica]
MKKLSAIILLLFTFGAISQTPCESGTAGPFDCNNLDLLSQIPLSTFSSVKANDSWGWTDPQDGKEYAIICLNEATAFVDVSDPLNPIYLGQLPGESNEHTTWRDAKTYNNFVFIVSEDTGHGMQVFDLTKLRNVPNPPVTFTKDAYYDEFGSAHNIVINQETGFAYAVGTDTFGGGPHFVDIQDPLNPVAAGGYAMDNYCHDAQVVIYNGPDTDYAGREILFGSNETEIVIEDVTDKNNVTTISTIDYNNVHYTHQGWLTEDQRFFLLGDELDEINIGGNSRTLIFDFEDLDSPSFHFEYEGPTGATDHNGYVKGNLFYLANNAAGLRVVDISEIENSTMEEAGFFDSYPTDDAAGFNGSWSVYPYFESGNIVISDRAEGMLLVRPSGTLSVPETTAQTFSVYPNPANAALNIQANQDSIEAITVVDGTGKRVFAETYDNALATTIVDTTTWASGLYVVTINKTTSYKVVKR